MASDSSKSAKRPEKLVIESDFSRLPDVEKFISDLCLAGGLDEDQSDNMAIALTELVNNAILHGNKQDPTKNVTLTVKYYDDRVLVSIKDEGEGFDPQQVANPTDPSNLWKQNGRGIFLVRNLIDEVEIRSSKKGTEFLLTEYIAKS